jgi:hypothetical protein
MRFLSWLRRHNVANRQRPPARQRGGYSREALSFRPRLEALEDRLVPSTLTVTSSLDDGSSGTLRAEIAAANSGDTITFDQSLSGSTINLDPAKGELLIFDKNVDIIGLGAANLAVSGQNQSRVFEFWVGTDSISGLTIENGFVTNDTYLYGKGGGGILNNSSTLTVTDCLLSGNNSAASGAYARYGRGGGIFNIGTLTVSGSTLSNNSASDEGGGIYNDSYYSNGTVTVTNSSIITGNTARIGGGIYNSSSLNVTDSTVNGNQAYHGGGIYNGNYYGSPATATVSSTTFSNNTAVNYGLGGAIANEVGSLLTVSDHSFFLANTAADGGAIGNYGTLTVLDSTFSGNSATDLSYSGGGAISTYFGNATVNNSTLFNNSANNVGGAIAQGDSDLTISGCTLSGNSANYGGAIYGAGLGDGGTLTVTGGSMLTNNSANYDGGGIYDARGTVTVSGGSTLSGNSAGHDGGGIYNGSDPYIGGSVIVSGSTLSGNSAGYEGGGIYIGSGYGLSTATITNSTLTANTASFAGGGIFNASGTVTVSNSSTITSNSAGSEGGGIYNGGAPFMPTGTLYVTDSTLCGNNAPLGADLRNLGANTLINSDVCGIALASTVTTVYNFDNNPSVVGQAVTLTAYVQSTGGETPTGTVTFMMDGNTVLGTGTLFLGSASLTIALLPVGTHTITAVYIGDSNSVGSTSAVFTQTVLSAQQELAQIVDQVNALMTAGTLSNTSGNALIVKLNNAITSLNNGNTIAGDNQLNAFINQTNAFLKAGKLDSTDEQTLVNEIELAIEATLVSPI